MPQPSMNSAQDYCRPIDTLLAHYDVVVVGAGPAGTAAAAGFERTGASVLLIEASPRAAFRFAGEWVHPAGAKALARLDLSPHGMTAGHLACEGFAVFPDDGSDAIRLPYAEGALGFTSEHGELVSGLRLLAAKLPGIHYVEGRVSQVEQGPGDGPATVTLQVKGHADRTVTTDRVVGADGRSSVVRKSLYGETRIDNVSSMAGIELVDVELPFEGFGHVFLGGPGPILLYRIGPGRARACLDIPVGHPGARRDARYLWEAFETRFPATLRPAFRHALENRRVAWASNRFMPRARYGEGRVALIGDAVGFYHPLTASGITIGLQDAEALVAAPDVDSYAKAREPVSYAPELLANALLQVFNREDEAAVAVRDAVYDTWRSSPRERERTMRLLGGEEHRVSQFATAFARIAMSAAATSAASGRPGLLPAFAEFAQWPAATLLPKIIRHRVRGDSSAVHPMAGLRIAPTAPDAPQVSERTPSDVPVDRLLANLKPAPPADGHTQQAQTLLQSLEGGDLAEHTIEQTLALIASVSVAIGGGQLDVAGSHASILALAQVGTALPGLRANIEQSVLRPVRAQLETTQSHNGSFGSLRETAITCEILTAAGMPVFHPRLRRAFRFMASRQDIHGRVENPLTTAAFARAILRCGAPLMDAAEAALLALSEGPMLEGQASVAAGVGGRLYRDIRAARIQPKSRRQKDGTASEADHQYCQEALLAVSRSFARPIGMLPGNLRTAVTCGYLLCRIADTIEDNPFFTLAERDERYAVFLDALYAAPSDPSVRRFELLFEDVMGDQIEAGLARHLSSVLRVYRTLPDAMQRKASRWVEEMVRGMQLYSHRVVGHDGFTALHTLEDLERYCYFVAGTVGHMLTDLFVEEFSSEGSALEMQLRENAEAFGLGLQFVNILKDITDDRSRKVSFIPRTSCAAQGLNMTNLVDLDKRVQAHAAVAPLFDRARQYLDRALAYCLSIPVEQTTVRLFCLLPLWMAARTLVLGRGNDAMFTPGAPVKISRDEVERLISGCMSAVGDNTLLAERYAELWRQPAQSLSAPSPQSQNAP